MRGLLFDCNQPVRIYAATVSEGCLSFLKAYLGKLGKVRGHLICSKEVLSAVKLVGLSDSELKRIVPESYPLAKTVVVGSPQDCKSFPSGNKDSVYFRKGLFHFICSAVVEHSIAQDDSKTAIHVGKSKHRSLRQAALQTRGEQPLASVLQTNERKIHSKCPETQLGGKFRMPASSRSNIEEPRRMVFLQQFTTGHQKTDDMIVRINGTETGFFMELVPV